MKKIFSLLAMVLMLNSCAPVMVVESTPKKAPPGQVKKATGSQSARQYAPGRQDKNH